MNTKNNEEQATKVRWKDVLNKESKIDLGSGFYLRSGSDAWFLGRNYTERRRKFFYPEMRFVSIYSVVTFLYDCKLRLGDYQNLEDIKILLKENAEQLHELREHFEVHSSRY